MEVTKPTGEETSDSEMSVDSRGSWQTVKGKKQSQRTGRKKRANKPDQATKEGSRKDADGMLKQQSERKERAPERIGVELCDRQGLQQSLASIETTLHAVLVGISEDLAKKRATACVRLSS